MEPNVPQISPIQKAFYIELTNIRCNINRKYIYDLFKDFKILKLYLARDLSNAKVYMDNLESLVQGVLMLKRRPLNNFEFGIQMEDNRYTANCRNTNDSMVADKPETFVNLFGEEVNVFYDSNTGEKWVSLNEVKKIGFELFPADNIPQHIDINLQMKHELCIYLSLKARRFLSKYLQMVPLTTQEVESIKQRVVDCALTDTFVSFTRSIEDWRKNVVTESIGRSTPELVNSTNTQTSKNSQNKDAKRDQRNSDHCSLNTLNSNNSRSQLSLNSSSYSSKSTKKSEGNSVIGTKTRAPSENLLGTVESAKKNERHFNGNVETVKANPEVSKDRSIENKSLEKTRYQCNGKDVANRQQSKLQKEKAPNTIVKTPENIKMHSVKSTDKKKMVTTSQLQITDPTKEEVLTNATTVRQIPHISNKKCSWECVGDIGFFLYGCTISEDTLIAVVLPHSRMQELDTLEELKSLEFSNTQDYIPYIGETIAVNDQEEGFVRGRVISYNKNGYVTALIDYGRIVNANVVHPLKDKYVDITEFSCVCKASAEVILLIKTESNKCSFETIKEGILSISINGNTYNAQCEKWNPFITLSPVDNIQSTVIPQQRALNDNDVVIVVSTNDKRELNVRTKELFQLLKKVTEVITTSDGPALKLPPSPGQLVLAPNNSDSKLYRAIVISIELDVAIIELIDYGYTCSVPVCDLRGAKAELASIDKTIIAIKQRGLNEESVQGDMPDIIFSFFNKQTKFCAVKVGGDLFDLKDPNGQYLSKLLCSSNDKDEKDISSKLANSSNEVEEFTLSKGTHSLICVNINLEGGYLVFWTGNSTMVKRFDVLLENIRKHVNSNNDVFIPKIGEMCLVYHEGDDEWYRGICLDIDTDGGHTIYLIDWDDTYTIQQKHIRSIPEDVAEVPEFAIFCNMKDLKEVFNKADPSKLQQIKDVIMEKTFEVNVLSRIGKYYECTSPCLTKLLSDKQII